MKVFYQNRDPKIWTGGDAIQVNETMKAIGKLGIETEFGPDLPNSSRGIDLFHIFHINFDWNAKATMRCINRGWKYVLSPIFFPQIYQVSKDDMAMFANNAKAVVCLSDKEKEEMITYLGIKGDNIKVIPNGVDKSIFNVQKISRKKKVISVGRLTDPQKGAMFVIEACRRAGVDLTFVGASDESRYSTKLKKYVTHYERVSQEELAKLYNEARVYVCSSLTERQSLGVLEGAACGCNIVDSVFNRGHKLLPSSAIVDPRCIPDLVAAIKEQLEKPLNNDFVPSWDDVAIQLKEVYESAVL